MTVIQTLPLPIETATEWGVRHYLAKDFVRADEADARRWLHALLFCGNREAELVARVAGANAAWIPMGGA